MISMIKPSLFIGIFAFLLSCSPPKDGPVYPDVKAPVAEKRPFEIIAKHGHKRVDNYYWLKNREDSAVINYLKAENKYLDTMTAHIRVLREKLYTEMKDRIKEKDESAPVKDGDFFYYTRFEEGYDYPFLRQ